MTDVAAAAPTHSEALEILAREARLGKLAAVIAYERAMWREGRDADGAAKKQKGKVSRSQKILDDLEAEPDVGTEDEDAKAAEGSVEDTLADLLARE